MPLLENDLVGLNTAIWASVFGEEAFPVPAEMVYDSIGRSPTLTGCVNISGGWDGSVAYVVPVDLARVLAASMFAMEPDELDDELIADAIGELANIVGGNIKGLIPEACELGLPMVATGTGYAVTVPGTRTVCEAAFEFAGRPFAVVLHSATDLPIS